MAAIPLEFSLFLDDVEIAIIGDYYPGDPGQTSGPPERCYPPEFSEFEITSAKVGDFELPKNWLSESFSDRLQDNAEEAAEEAYSQLCEKSAEEAAAEWEDV